MNKKILRKIITPFIVGVVVFAGGYYFLFNTSDDGAVNDDTVVVINEPDTPEAVQKYFNERLQSGVIERIGQPIHGFVPSMFMQAYSGIVPQDFNGADALLGEYKIVERELIFIMDEGGPIHTAAEALSEAGMKTLFLNIANRAGVTRDKGALYTTREEIDELLLFLGAPSDIPITKCLPEQRDVGACIEIYQPVCATIKVQCITAPCDPVQKTFANSCKACSNPLVSDYTEGACLDEK